VSGLLARIRGASTVEDERERLRSAQESAARQLEAMKQELAARLQAIREREHQLELALARAPAPPVAVLPSVDETGVVPSVPERTPTADDTAERRRIERRLAELREAERLFLVTQAELAARSEAVAAREKALERKERSLGAGDRSGQAEVAALEERLRQLERTTAPAGGDAAAGFTAGLESLRRRGTRRPG
jgi:DNA repair exonuclease SbcCD ATPase subunit